jgi:hypothetical protein
MILKNQSAFYLTFTSIADTLLIKILWLSASLKDTSQLITLFFTEAVAFSLNVIILV